MKKYKLIKEYPNSPVLGTIVTQTESKVYKNLYQGLVEGTYCTLNVDKYPEFWEEIPDRDYEILSLINPTNHNVIIKEFKTYSPEYKLNKFNYLKIYSVRRLSDGEVFTIGDTIYNKNCKIYDIIINIDGKLLVGVTGCELRQSLDSLELLSPIFTTEDGVNIFDGDVYSSVFIKNLSWITNKQKAHLVYKKHYRHDLYKFFSTKEAAEDYIIKNKPCLSLSDLEIKFDDLGLDFYGSKVSDGLIELVKSKLK